MTKLANLADISTDALCNIIALARPGLALWPPGPALAAEQAELDRIRAEIARRQARRATWRDAIAEVGRRKLA